VEFGLLIPPIYKPDELVRITKFAEANSFSSFWYPDEKFFRDPYIGLTQVALNSQRLRIGPCVTDPYSRHPIMTAVVIASLEELAPGRTWLGLGAGGRGFQAMAIERKSPVTAIREAVEIIRCLLAGENVDYKGQVIRLNNRRLDFKPPGTVPILIATGHGHKIQMLAGEVADGAMLANFASRITIEAGISRIKLGAEKSNCSIKDLHMISRVDFAIHPDANEARKAIAPKILSAIRASYPALSYFDDLPEFELSSKFLSIIKRKDYESRTFYANPEHCAPLIPTELYKHFSVSGTPNGVGNQLEEIRSLGYFDEITIHPTPSGDQSIFDCLELLNDTLRIIS
jgi:5,10-methylenetetrahydromethanopterin reductase